MGESFRYLIAKNDSAKREWLPLWVHCVDTYHIMQYLLIHWMTGGALHAITNINEPEAIRKSALFLAMLHDYGKASLTFQSKIAEGVEDFQRIYNKAGLTLPSPKDPELRNGKEMPHGIAGEIMLRIKGCPATLAAVVGAHHGKPWEKGPDVADEIEEILEEGEEELYRNFRYGLRLWGGKARRREWINAQDAFFKWALDELGIDNVCNLNAIGDTEAVVLTGLVVMADWLASNENYFPLIGYEQDAPLNMKERALHAIKRISLPPTWQPSINKNYVELSKKRFGFCPNTIQASMVEAVINSVEPGLFILEAPMGIGKTEAALLSAETFPENRVAGLLFALPTQATANGIFPRIIEWGKGQDRQNVLSIRLAHGLAAMNAEYANLMDTGNHAECTVDDYEENRLIVHEFFQGSKQALLADFVVGTVDQVLLASLKQKHFMLRHLGLCGKVVIIDECHAYDAYMNEYLERTLQWLGAYRTPVIMLSATLPYERRSALIDAYMGYPKGHLDEAWRKSLGYPLLTWTDGKLVNQKELNYSGLIRSVEIEKTECSDTGPEELSIIIDLLRTNLKEGGCAAIIVNTVKRAQLFADQVRRELSDKKVLLLHSRFISEDRLDLEKELLSHLGKNSEKKDRDGFVAIGTQVIEQSLDYDVDLLITDLCPMDLLLQRIGRLHRHPKHDAMRPDILKAPKCYVMGTSDKLEKGSVAVYGRYLLMRTRGFLPEKVSLPVDIAKLVQSVYDNTCSMATVPAGYEEAKKEYEDNRILARRNADAFRLIPPGKEDTINRFLEASTLADEEQAKAQVRSGDTCLEVIALFEKEDSLTRAPWRYDDCFETVRCPAPSEGKAIANQRLRFPSWVTELLVDQDIAMPPEWENSVWLRKQRLLILDQNGDATKGDLIIHYDHNNGLTVERRKPV